MLMLVGLRKDLISEELNQIVFVVLYLQADFAMKEGFGGVMIWSFDMDDFSGLCPGSQKYPLLQSIYKATKKNMIYRTTKKIGIYKTTSKNTTVSV